MQRAQGEVRICQEELQSAEHQLLGWQQRGGRIWDEAQQAADRTTGTLDATCVVAPPLAALPVPQRHHSGGGFWNDVTNVAAVAVPVITDILGGGPEDPLGDGLAIAERTAIEDAGGGAGGATSAAPDAASNAEPQGGLNLYRYKDPTSTTGEGWTPGDRFLKPPWRGTPKLTWEGNASLLRSEMQQGRPIYESYVDSNGELLPSGGPGRPGQFLRAERNLLRSHGWTYDPGMRAWLPPGS